MKRTSNHSEQRLFREEVLSFTREICVYAHLTQTRDAQRACAEMRSSVKKGKIIFAASSGGHFEQLMMLKPSIAILDETDSGLDVDAVRLASEGIHVYQQENPDSSLLIITHSTKILESLHVDYTHVMVNGHIIATGDASLIEQINREGYEQFKEQM